MIRFALCLILSTVATVAMAAEKPNIIFIMADDLGYGDLGSYGQTKIKTPELDKLAQQGMRFTDFYAGTAVCAPTRCSLMTGKHTGHTYIRANSPGYPGGQTPIPADTETVATMLKRQGYQTACIGKWGLGTQENSGDPLKQGFDLFYGYYDQYHAHEYYTDHLFRNGQRVELDGKTYSHDLMTDEALKFLDDTQGNPFFLYLPYTIPHTKFQVPDLGQYKDKPWKENHKIQAAMISRLDRDVGIIAKKVADLGLAKDTLIMFTSDHGAHGQGGTGNFFNASGPLRDIKRSMYEGGLRVPLIAYWPGTVPAGTTSNLPCAFWDMMPTLAELSGGKPKAEHDGISIVPTLRGNFDQQKKHDYLYWELFEGKTHNRAIRIGQWKGVIPNWYKSHALELYNLNEDIGETQNVAKEHPAIVAEMEKKMAEAHVDNPFWNVESRGFNVEAATKANGVEPEKR